MELSTEDKERIEQEAGVFRYDSIGFRAFKKGAEYATIYEREKQADLRNEVIDEVLDIVNHPFETTDADIIISYIDAKVEALKK